ncbi:hypothetical protein [Patulibacter sp. SYSU D01012]|uniref:hypothetical protein n=1 Tax=Patulibacter sp. SYSU D01012 TaxID=2817381 RepID=UPI001B310F9F|nr:hypothetical protein [Patulibacter sp. SYSU D01012]
MRAAPARRAAALLAAAVLLLGAGVLLGRLTAGGDDAAPAAPRATAPAAVRPPELAVGLVTGDAGVLAPPGQPVAGFARAQALTDRIAPEYVRVDVRWDLLQPQEGAPLDPDRPVGAGCGRDGAAPCAGDETLTRTLAALKAAQAAHPGRYRPVLTFWGMPAWAGKPADAGCEAARAREGARPLRPGGEPAYRAAVAAVWRAVRGAGLDGADWSPWNEPNAPYFVAPQRQACRGDAAPTSPAVYARMARAMDAELDRLRAAVPAGGPGRGDRLVLGELAAWPDPTPKAVPADEFLRALPDDVLCRADVIGLHGYLEARPPAGRGEPVAGALAELDRRPCLDGHPAWVTETGVGAPHAGATRDVRPATLAAECRLLHRQLERWYRDPRVTAAFQYSVREDPSFPTGLTDEAMTRTYPVAAAWAAWGGDRAPTAAPPALPGACASTAAAARADEDAPPG